MKTRLPARFARPPAQQQDVSARTPAADAKLEILLFTLGTDPATGRDEAYGIDVFQVREVMRAPEITRTPDARAPVAGMIGLRGTLVPVIDLAQCAGLPKRDGSRIMILTESSGRTQGFLVDAVDSILRLDGAAMKVPPDMLACGARGLVTAVAALTDGRLIMMIDVEKVLADNSAHPLVAARDHAIDPLDVSDRTVLFAGDSALAEKRIAQ